MIDWLPDASIWVYILDTDALTISEKSLIGNNLKICERGSESSREMEGEIGEKVRETKKGGREKDNKR
jgi:hypothetical protein